MALGFFEKSRKPLSKLNAVQLRKEELMAESRRKRLEKKAVKLSKDKEKIFERGAKETSPELRRTLAQQFDLNTTEQLMVGRQLNIATKELMIVSRIRAVKQNTGVTAVVRATDLVGIETAMDRDAAAAAAYQEILNDVMDATTIDDGDTMLSETGQDVLRAWQGLDTGTIPDAKTALAEADRQTRERMSTMGE